MKDILINFELEAITNGTLMRATFTYNDESKVYAQISENNINLETSVELFCYAFNFLKEPCNIKINIKPILVYHYLNCVKYGDYSLITNQSIREKLKKIFTIHTISFEFTREESNIKKENQSIQNYSANNKVVKNNYFNNRSKVIESNDRVYKPSYQNPNRVMQVKVWDTVTWKNLTTTKLETKTIVPEQIEQKPQFSYTRYPHRRLQTEKVEKLVGDDEISINAPLAKNSLGKSLNSCINVTVDNNVTKYRIVNIERNKSS